MEPRIAKETIEAVPPSLWDNILGVLLPLIVILLDSVIKPIFDNYWVVGVFFGFISVFILYKIINAEDEYSRKELKKYLGYTVVAFLVFCLLAFSFKKIEATGSLEKLQDKTRTIQIKIETSIKCGNKPFVKYDNELQQCTCSSIWYDYVSETRSCKLRSEGITLPAWGPTPSIVLWRTEY